jgi:ketosteroid isomerase-like protein
MSGSSDAENYIRSAGARFMSAFNSGDVASVTRFYADDAVLVQANQPMARGSSAIRDVYSGFMTANKASLNFSPDRIVQSCDLAYEYGRYTLQITPNSGTAMTDQGNYMTVWRRMPNGDWKIVADSVVTAQPMAPMR